MTNGFTAAKLQHAGKGKIFTGGGRPRWRKKCYCRNKTAGVKKEKGYAPELKGSFRELERGNLRSEELNALTMKN